MLIICTCSYSHISPATRSPRCPRSRAATAHVPSTGPLSLMDTAHSASKDQNPQLLIKQPTRPLQRLALERVWGNGGPPDCCQILKRGPPQSA